MPVIDREFVRTVPAQRWAFAAAIALVLVLLATGTWEFAMRGLQLRAGDLDDGDAFWAVERRRVDSGPRDPIVLVGDSRILFDTDLDEWQRLSGRRPIQLGMEGTNGAPVLEDLSKDEHFAGLVVVGMAPTSYFREGMGLHNKAISYVHDQSPSQRVSHWLDLPLQRVFAFLDNDYSLFKLIERHRYPERKGFDPTDAPYYNVWKLRETSADRQTRMWPRIETDAYLQEHARRAWGDFDGKVFTTDQVQKAIERTKAAVARIRARGGDVVFLRPPSDGRVIINEERRLPRATTWDRLLGETAAYGFHFQDDPAAAAMHCPEWSHLNARDATVFTRIYVSAFLSHVPWLKAHAANGVPDEHPDRG